MGRKLPADTLRHMSFAVVGGFFGAYAILGPSGLFGNAQTVNLLQILFDSLFGHWYSLLLHAGGLLCYILGVMTAVILHRKFHRDTGRISPFITFVCTLLLYVLPYHTPGIVFLYPIFFAMSFQWTAFAGASGFNSSTIFSTNNVKQAVMGFAEYCCDRDYSHLRRTVFFGQTIIAFHLGAALGFLSIRLLSAHAVLCALPLILLSYMTVIHEEHAAAAQEEFAPAPAESPVPENVTLQA